VPWDRELLQDFAALSYQINNSPDFPYHPSQRSQSMDGRNKHRHDAGQRHHDMRLNGSRHDEMKRAKLRR
jgi:hypothetical protein